MNAAAHDPPPRGSCRYWLHYCRLCLNLVRVNQVRATAADETAPPPLCLPVVPRPSAGVCGKRAGAVAAHAEDGRRGRRLPRRARHPGVAAQYRGPQHHSPALGEASADASWIRNFVVRMCAGLHTRLPTNCLVLIPLQRTFPIRVSPRGGQWSVKGNAAGRMQDAPYNSRFGNTATPVGT